MKQVAKLALQILGIYTLVSSIKVIQAFINAFGMPADEISIRITLISSSFISLGLLIVVGLYLILKAEILSDRLLSDENDIKTDIKIKPIELQAIAFSIVGVVLIVLTIPKIFQLGVNIYALKKYALERGAEQKLARDTLSYGVGLLIQFLLGVLLFFSGNSIANLWHKVVQRLQYERKI